MSGEVVNNSCRNCGAKINGCVSCGRRTIGGEGWRVGMSFTPEQAYRLAIDCTDHELREKLICAIGTLDPHLQSKLRAELLSSDGGCKSCSAMADQVTALEAERDELSGILVDLEDDRVCSSCTNKYSDGYTPRG